MANIRKRPIYEKINGLIYPKMFSPKCFREAMEYKPQPGDVLINIYPKCGTTWMQNVAMYIFRKGKELDHPSDFLRCAPFIDMLGQEGIDKMPRPGAIKTHLPYSRMPYSSDAKYVFVARNPKDVCVSMYYHTRNNEPGLGFWNGEFNDFFELFVEGELEYNDCFDHLLDWFPHRNDPNVFHTTYEDMKKDIKDVVLRLSTFLGKEYIDVIQKDNKILNNIIHFSGFQYMKKHLSNVWDIDRGETHIGRTYSGLRYTNEFTKALKLPENLPEREYVRKGIVGDWKNHFSEEQNARFNAKFFEKFKGTEVLQWYSLE